MQLLEAGRTATRQLYESWHDFWLQLCGAVPDTKPSGLFAVDKYSTPRSCTGINRRSVLCSKHGIVNDCFLDGADTGADAVAGSHPYILANHTVNRGLMGSVSPRTLHTILRNSNLHGGGDYRRRQSPALASTTSLNQYPTGPQPIPRTLSTSRKNHICVYHAQRTRHADNAACHCAYRDHEAYGPSSQYIRNTCDPIRPHKHEAEV